MPDDLLALGAEAFAQGNLPAAARALHALLEQDPSHREALCNAGYIAYLRGDLAQAEQLLVRGESAHGSYAPILNNLGLLRQAQRRFEEAEALYRRACEHDSGDALALANLGSLLLLRGAISEATATVQRAVGLAPDEPSVLNAFALCRQEVADTQTTSRLFLRAWERAPQRLELRNNWLMSLLYEPAINSRIFRDAEKQSLAEARVDTASVTGPDAGKIREVARIGFLSADLYQHPVGSIIDRLAPALKALGKSLFFYAPEPPRDAVGERISRCGEWRQTLPLDDIQLARCIADDRLDVLLDLSGLSAGSRATVFRHRPAARQYSWLGLPAASGNAFADGVLLSADLLGAHGASFFIEPTLPVDAPPFLLPDFSDSPHVGELPALSKGRVTFGCFNNPAKLNDECLALWAGVLRVVPGSGLLIKHRAANDSAYQAHLRGRFEAEGIEATRIQFRGTSPHAQMLAEYGDIDIALDPYPFNGGITSLEALWMGVPVLSLSGLRPVSRQGLAILEACGLENWTCETPQAMWRRAETACRDLQALQLQRTRLREQLLASPLNDAPRFAGALISALADGQLHQVGDQ